MNQSMLCISAKGDLQLHRPVSAGDLSCAPLRLLTCDQDQIRSPIRVNREFLLPAAEKWRRHGRNAFLDAANAYTSRIRERPDQTVRSLLGVASTDFTGDLFRPWRQEFKPWRDPALALRKSYIYLGLILQRIYDEHSGVMAGRDWRFIHGPLCPGYKSLRLYQLNHNPIKDFYVLKKKVNHPDKSSGLNDYVGVANDHFGVETAPAFWQLKTSYQRWFWFLVAEGLISVFHPADPGQNPTVRLTDEGFSAYDLYCSYFGPPRTDDQLANW